MSGCFIITLICHFNIHVDPLPYHPVYIVTLYLVILFMVMW